MAGLNSPGDFGDMAGVGRCLGKALKLCGCVGGVLLRAPLAAGGAVPLSSQLEYRSPVAVAATTAGSCLFALPRPPLARFSGRGTASTVLLARG